MQGTIPRQRRLLIDGIVRAARGLKGAPGAALLRAVVWATGC